jgi:hypothetical protein
VILSASNMSERFNISTKHDHAWLVAHQNWGYNLDKEVAGDIVKNAMELDGRIAWGEVINRYSCRHGGKEYTGTPAITFSIAKTVGAGVIRIGWGMSTPEVVYMSGAHYARFLGGTLASLSDRVEKIEEGKVEFKSEQEKQDTLEEAGKTLGRLGTFRGRLRESLGEYAALTLPGDPKYLEVLEALPYLNPRKMGIKPTERYVVLDSVKSGDIATAHRIVAAHQPQPTASA